LPSRRWAPCSRWAGSAAFSGADRPTRVATLLIEPVAKLIEAFNRLPGIGPKTAQRLTYHLLRAPEGEARMLASALVAVREEVVFCERCFNISDAPLCPICRDAGRDQARLCVVEEPLDVLAIERTGEFRGVYHVLNGAISPIDGVGPDRLKIRELLARVDEAASATPFAEVILATNPTLEGEATAMYLDERLAGKVGSVTRIARGIPVGGDLEYADEVTLIRALQGRRAIGERPA
jgi:recombination protein RecR